MKGWCPKPIDESSIKLEQVVGFEPTTFSLATRHSTTELYLHKLGGGGRDRTDDIMLAKHTLSQLSYTPNETIILQNYLSVNLGTPARIRTEKNNTPFERAAFTNLATRALNW